MKTYFAAFACALTLGLAGCSHEEQPHRRTVAEVQAEIDKAQNDPKMPDNIKQMVLGKLQGAKAQAEKDATAGK